MSRFFLNIKPEQAIRLQQQLQEEIIIEGNTQNIRFAAGVDVGYFEDVSIAAVAVLELPGLDLCDYSVGRRKIKFPYIPGLLSFREIPVILDALNKIKIIPDVILCDGQGIAHPRRMGIASHLGILTNYRTIGVAKTRLIGRHDDVPDRKGEWVYLHDEDEIIGAVLRTREAVKPLYVSIGHRIDLVSAIEVVMRCVTAYRLPEPVRSAHHLAEEAKYEKNK